MAQNIIDTDIADITQSDDSYELYAPNAFDDRLIGSTDEAIRSLH